MDSVRRILLRIQGDNSGALAALRQFQAALSGVGAFFRGIAASAQAAGRTMLAGIAAPVQSIARVMDSSFRIAQQSASSLANGLTRLGIAAIALRALGEAAASLGQAIVGPNRQLETLTVAFTGILGSGQAALALLNDLRAFAESTPFQFTDLATFAQRLLGVQFAAEDVIPIMSAIGAAVSRVGGGKFEIERVTEALTQMQSLGRASAEELNRLSDANIPAYRILAEQLGVTGGELRKMLEQGLLPASQAIPALLRGMAEFGGTAMTAQAQTLTGILSNLADRFTFLRTIAGQPMFEVLRTELGNLLTALKAPGVEQFAANLGVVLGAALQLAINAVRSAAAAFVDFGQRAYAALTQLTGNVPAAIGAVLAGFAPLGSALRSLLAGNFDQALADAGAFVSNIGAILISGLAGLAGSLFSGGLTTIASYAEGLIAGAATYVMRALDYITSLISSFLQGFSPPRQGKLSSIDTWFPKVLNAYLDSWTEADWGILDKLTGRIASIFEGLVEQGRTSIQEAARIVIGADGAAGLNQLITQALNDIRQTGAVAAERMLHIQGLLGKQYADVFQEIRAQLDAAALNAQIDRLRADLDGLNDPAARQALDDALQRAQDAQKNARTGTEYRQARDQVALIRQQQKEQQRQRSVLESQLKTLERQQQAIQDQLSGHEALSKFREREITFLERIVAAHEKLAGGAGGGADTEAAEAKRRADAEFAYRKSVADTTGQLALEEQKLAQLEQGTVEYYQTLQEVERLRREVTAAATRAQEAQEAEAEARKQAEFDYQKSISDTAGQLALEEQKLAGLEQGSVEYIQTQQEIARLRQQLAAEQAGALDKEAQEAKRRQDAEFAYQLALEDTAGKIELYRQKLAGLEQGSAEYFETLTTLVGLEQQLAREREAAAKAGGAGKPGGAGGGGKAGAGIPAFGGVEGSIFGGAEGLGEELGTKVQDAITEATNTAKEKWNEFWTDLQTKGQEKLDDLKTRASGIFDNLKALPANVFGGLVADAQNFVQGIQGATTSLAQFGVPIETLKAQVSGIGPAFQQFGANVAPAFEPLKAAFQSLAPAFTATGAILIGVFSGLVGFITGALPGLGLVISGIVTTISGVVQAISGVLASMIAGFVALVQGDWLGTFKAAEDIARNLVEGVIRIFEGLVQIVVGIVGAFVGGIVGFFTNLYDTIVGNSIIPDLVNGVLDWFRDLKEYASLLIRTWVDQIRMFFIELARDAIEKALEIRDKIIDAFNEMRDFAIVAWEFLKSEALRHISTLVTDAVEKAQAIKDGILAKWEELKTAASTKFEDIKTGVVTKLDEVLTAITNLGTKFMDAGTALIASLWNGISARIGQLITDAKNALAPLADLLPGSEPKDRTSPLYGLARRGEAIITNIQRGLDRATLDLGPQAQRLAEQLERVREGMQVELTTGLAPAVALGTLPVRGNQLLPRESPVYVTYAPKVVINGSGLDERQLERVIDRRLEADHVALINKIDAGSKR